MAFTNRQIHLAARPKGLPKESDFALVTTEVPALQDGQFLVRINYVSVDPYMRGLMNEGRSYVNHFNVGDVVLAARPAPSSIPGTRNTPPARRFWGSGAGRNMPYRTAGASTASMRRLHPCPRRWACWACRA